MIEDIAQDISKSIVQRQDAMVTQFLAKHGLMDSTFKTPFNIEQVKKNLAEQGLEILESKETIGGTTTVKLQLVKIIDTMQYSMTFKIDGVNFK